ncbi:MAG: hypothetical protein LIO46_00440 [Clostridiales bacterium]|nr:hypothetical protein [Clostridiales bacterium]
METRKKGAKRILLIAVILMLVSMLQASLLQSNGGKVAVKDIRFETTTGFQMSGLLFVPEGVSS